MKRMKTYDRRGRAITVAVPEKCRECGQDDFGSQTPGLCLECETEQIDRMERELHQKGAQR